MFRKLINAIKNFFLKRKLQKQYRVGTLVYQPETLMYFIVEAYASGLVMLTDEYRMITAIDYIKLRDNFIPVKSVVCPENSIEYRINNVDTVNYTIELDGHGYYTLQDLNEGNF